MAGLLDGLEQFGLSGLDSANLFEKEKKPAGKAGAAKPLEEQDFLFDKTYVCPICDKEIKARTVRVGKAKLAGTDLDLRPRYEQVDLLKYDVIMCPNCGYTSLSRYFKYLTSNQAKLIKEKISKVFKKPAGNGEIYTYEEALERYKLALANAIVKIAKPSEKAYICLKTAWLLRGQAEHLKKDEPDYAQKKKRINEQEDQFLQNALEGFLTARQTEDFPMCGMDEATVDYLIAVTAMKFGQYDVSSRLVSSILLAPSANPRMKDKARDLKEMLVQKIKAKNKG